jgi:hypothetical protein
VEQLILAKNKQAQRVAIRNKFVYSSQIILQTIQPPKLDLSQALEPFPQQLVQTLELL